MYPGHYANTKPDTPAAINTVTGETLTWHELNDRSNQLAQYLHAQGLRRGDHIALFMENHLRFFEVAWAAFRSGLYITAINRYLTAEEAAYVVTDSDSKALVTSYALASVASELPAQIDTCDLTLMTDGVVTGFDSYEDTLAQQPATPLDEEPLGIQMLYSSGTTGRPKGIKKKLPDAFVSDDRVTGVPNAYGFSEDTVYLSPAPLYHAAPFAFCMNVMTRGGTVAMMEKFDAEESLRCVQDFQVTHSQWVPTMFVRMMKLPEETRATYDLSSHQAAIHAAAPCPVEIKRQMIEWWGPIIHEYYAGTEGNGSTGVDSETWLKHPGTVGQCRAGVLHICDEEGNELPPGETGIIYFEQAERPFVYHNAPDKTKNVEHPTHSNWTALGDVGYVDEEGFLYLTDRKAFMIISGGVNIYPQEIEDALVVHDKVQDVAVFGVPNPDFGEEVKAVVEVAPGIIAGDALADELLGYAKQHLANYKVPRSIDFTDELPRLPTGKLYKRILRDKYWGKHDSRIV